MSTRHFACQGKNTSKRGRRMCRQSLWLGFRSIRNFCEPESPHPARDDQGPKQKSLCQTDRWREESCSAGTECKRKRHTSCNMLRWNVPSASQPPGLAVDAELVVLGRGC